MNQRYLEVENDIFPPCMKNTLHLCSRALHWHQLAFGDNLPSTKYCLLFHFIACFSAYRTPRQLTIVTERQRIK